MGYAFISYSTENQMSADTIRNLFSRNNIDTWMAPYNIPLGSEYPAEITKAIRNCSCFVLLLSNSSQSSPPVKREVELAVVKFKKTIITVQIEEVMLNDIFTFHLSGQQMIAVHKIDDESYEVKKILESVKIYTRDNDDNAIEADDYAKPQTNNEATDNDPTDSEASSDITSWYPEFFDGRYLLQEAIGSGGFGTVYKAWDAKNKKSVAVKIKTGNFSADKIIELHRGLIGKANEFLCQIYDASVSDTGAPYIVMEWLEGYKSLLDAGGCREFYEQFDDDYLKGSHIMILIDALNGIKYLHSNGIVHANINPSNILTNGCSVKLIDYTSAFYANVGVSWDNEHTVALDSYNSPERQKDYRSDLYSVGMVAIKWLTGAQPMLDEHDNVLFPESDIDNEAASILKKATMANPNDRYQSADEFISALEKYYEHYLNKGNDDLFMSCEPEDAHDEPIDLQSINEADIIEVDEASSTEKTDTDNALANKIQDSAANTPDSESNADKIDDSLKVKGRGHLVGSYRRVLDISEKDCINPISILMPDDTHKFFDFCDEFVVSNQKKLIVVRQKDESGEFLFFIFRVKNGKTTLVEQGQDQKKVYRWFREKHREEYVFSDEKSAESAEKKVRHFAQDAALKLFSTADNIPQILMLPDKYEHINSNAFAKLIPNGKKYIRQIVISESVQKIDDNAFAGLIVTEAVHISKSVKNVGSNAFTLVNGAYIYCEGSSFLSLLRCYDNARIIEDVPFRRTRASDLTQVLAELSESKGITHIKSNTLPHTTQKKEIEELIIPNGVCVIDRHAFDNATVKDRVVIPSSVTRIGEYAFDLLPQAYVECNADSYAYLYCKENGFRNSVDIAAYKAKGVCAHCGGKLLGVFKKKCSLCGKEKDY